MFPQSTLKPLQKALLWIWISALFLVACQGNSTSPGTVSPTPASPSLELTSCQLAAPGLSTRIQAQCGRLSVWEDPVSQSGRKISLNIAVLPALSRNPQPDPLFFLAGGPGEAATESFLVVYAAFSLLNLKRDIVLVDQRGTGGSNPLDCEVDQGQDELTEDSSDTEQTLQLCLDSMDADPRLYTTAVAMDDLDKVRIALGYTQINLYGASYGTRAALIYAHQHPEALRSMVLDGIAPPNWTLGPTTSQDAQRALDMIFARCAAQPDCQATFPNLIEEFQAILTQVRQQPVTVDLAHPTSGEPTEFILDEPTLASTIHTLSYAPETASLLPLMIHTAYAEGNFRLIAAFALTTQEKLGHSISAGMRFSILCAEDIPFFPREPASEGYLGDFVTQSFREICNIWPQASIPADFKQPVISHIPTLLLSGEADPVTPPANGELAAQTLPNSLHLVAPGQGHIVVYRGCLPKVATRFIEIANIEDLETDCVQEIQAMPFFTQYNGQP